MTTNFIGVLLPNSPNYTVNTGFSTELYDAEGGQTITVETGASLVLKGALGANTIRLAGTSHDWQVYRDGSTAIAVRADGSRVELPANTTAQTLAFSDASFDLRVAVSGSTASVMLGTQVLGTTAAPIGEPPLQGSTEKSAWTLVVTSSRGIYSSDGTAAGSAYLYNASTFGGGKVIANADGTGAIVLGNKVYGTDGTAAGSGVLVDAIPSYGLYGSVNYYRFANKIVIPDGGESGNNALVTDGTKSGTQVIADMPNAVVDVTNQALWGGIATGPYGRELFKTSVTDSSATTVMIKDIASGSASALTSDLMASLPDGRLVFAANDVGNGYRPWVSDGTPEGTFRLADLVLDPNGSTPVISIGGKVLAIAFGDGFNTSRLVSTDGTPAGTKMLDMSFPSSSIEIMGKVGDRLFFKSYAGDPRTGTKSIFSTDGTVVQKVADITSNANLLAFDDTKAFFKVADSAHGDELWVATLADGKFGLVKDLLPGSGSALAETYPSSVFMAQGKLAFTAFTSATTSGFFLSDGTEQGTWQIGSQRPSQTMVIGTSLVFADTAGLHAVSLAGAKADPVLLTASLTSQSLQSDGDQIYYLTATGTLCTWNGTGTPLALADKVAQFKVVADNAVYFTLATASGTGGALWFSDGTAAGTHYVSTLPQDYFNLSTAVALHTPGVAFPAENKAPVFASASVNGATLTLSFTDDSALDAAKVPPAGAFKLEGTSATITAVTVNADTRKVMLTLSEPVKSSDVLKIGYTDPTSGNDAAAVQDVHGNDAASFTSRPVQNLSADKEGPVLSAATVDGATLTLAYSDANRLDGSHLPATGAFKLEGTAATVTAVALDSTGKKLVLSLSQPVASTDAVKISYTDPTSGDDAAAVQDSFGNDAASVAGQAVDNKTPVPQAKAPWTLLAATNSGLFASDGTSAGTKFVLKPQSMYSVQLVVNADHTGAVLVAAQTAWGVDGSGSAPVQLANNLGYSSMSAILGKYIAVSNVGIGQPGGFVTDGTAAGTKILENLTYGTVDSARQVIWHFSSSSPYGNELWTTRITDSGAATAMVKDIWPGSLSGYSGYGGSVLLPNGKLLFSASDGTSGNEPWISDGTEAGTFLLADLQSGSYASSPETFVAFGNLAGFSAIVTEAGAEYRGRELVVTDGTSAGTKTFDINPGGLGSYPQMLGSVGDTLYFSAEITSGDTTTRALFSTDGTAIKRLADTGIGATLLGTSGGKTFFSIPDASHGAELWAADSAKGTIGLVKDILPGTGSALAGDAHAVAIGGKLAFQAYTSASTQALFLSDGSAEGTIQLNATLSASATFGNTLVYGDGAKVYGLDASAAQPAKVELTSASAIARVQADADQAFFSLANGDLYATDGTTSGTVALAHGVKAFKVVAENALYIVEQVAGGTGYSLNYSDGTAAGTYFVGYVDGELVNGLDNAVVVQTIGVPTGH